MGTVLTRTSGSQVFHRLALATVLGALLVAAFGGGSAHGANPKALILGSTITPGAGPCTTGTGSLEECEAIADGFDVTVVDDATWSAMTAADFAKYQALIIGDPTCSDTVDGAASANASVWQSVVMASGGNRVIIGTDPVFHAQFGGGNAPTGAPKLIKNGIAFAGSVAGATGAYVDISCESSFTTNGTPFSFLDGLTTKAPGSFTTEYAPCFGAISIVAQSGPTTGLHDSDLSDWGCSVHQDFKTWASDYTPLAIATDATTKTYCANDVDTGALACGAPYILVAGSGIAVTSSIKLDPATATNPVGSSHTVTATITVSGSPVPGKTVTFSVDNGPDLGKTGTAVTNANGQATFTYTNNGTAGTDTISASFIDDLGALEKATATKTWTAAATHSLTVTKSSSGSGTVTSSPSGIDCGATCAASFTDGTMVTLTATPGANSTFTGWGGACTGTGTCTVTMDQDRSVTATFALITHALTVTKSGSGSGMVTSSPSGIDCGVSCSASFTHGTVVTLTATPDLGSTFTGWSGGACTGTGTCTVTMDQDRSVTATFDLVPTHPRLSAGYWKNHQAQTTALLPITLGTYTVDSFAKATAVFRAMNCSNRSSQNAIGCLAAQLLAAKLNVKNGAGTCIAATIADADTFLSGGTVDGVTGITYIGPSATYGLTAAARALAIQLKDALDAYNNGGGC